MNEGIVRASRDVLARHARSFRLASIYLGRRRRDEAAVTYAFCRLVDDAVDEQRDPDEASRALVRIERALEAETPPPGVIAAYKELALRRGFGLGPARELIAGARGDLARVRVADDGELRRYCYRVAGTVGLMMARIVGVKASEAIPHAVDLGIAMQLTNICRDVLEDAGRDRVYLPATRLRELGVSQGDIVARRADNRAVASIVSDLLEIAESYYRSGDAGMRFIPWRPRLAILVASRVYRAIGRRLRRRYRCDALRGRVVVPRTSKLLWVVAAFGSWVATMVRGLAGRFRFRSRARGYQLQHGGGLLPAMAGGAGGGRQRRADEDL